MLKISHAEIKVGTEFAIRNSWRTAVAKALNKDEESYPFLFKVIDIDDHVCVCESVPDKQSKKKHMLSVSTMIIRYLNGEEVPDCHCGLYFRDYLPMETEKLLLTNVKNDTIVPAQFRFSISMEEQYTVGKDGGQFTTLPYLDFEILNLLTDETASLGTYAKHSWKLLHGPETYMGAVERMYRDTFIHKGYVMQVCAKFAEWLRSQSLDDDAEALMGRAKVHDNSKICNKDEFRALTGIINDRSCLGDAKAQLSAFKQDSIELHWKHNAHHPEHYAKHDDMSRLDRMEMCCDWMARALQYKTNLLEFVETRQAERFHFPELMYDEVLHYCKVLASLFE